MTSITFSKNERLLDASLDSLHIESIEWQKEISFWKDEMTFFYKLFHKPGWTNSWSQEDIGRMESELLHINLRLDELNEEVQSHEQSLSAILKTISLEDESAYREAHIKILMNITNVYTSIRNFKKEVFRRVANM